MRNRLLWLPSPTCIAVSRFTRRRPLLNADQVSASEPQTDAAPLAVTSEQLQSALAKITSDIEATQTQHDQAVQRKSPDWLLSSLQTELNLLKYLELLNTQQQVTLEERVELTEQLETSYEDPSEWVFKEINATPPFSFLLLEQLRHDLADAQAREETFELEFQTTRNLLDHAKEFSQEKQRSRRKTRETLRVTTDPKLRIQLERRLVNLEHGCRVGEQMMSLRNLELEAKELERQAHLQRIKTLTGAIELIRNNAPFHERDLNAKLAEIERKETDLRNQLSVMQTRLMAASKLASSPTANDHGHSRLSTSRDLLRQGLQTLNEAIADLVILRQTWKERYRVENRLVSANELESLAEQLVAFQGYLGNARQVLDLKIQNTRDRLTHLQASESANDEAVILQDLLNIQQDRTVLLHQAEQLVGRFHQELDGDSGFASLQEGLGALTSTAQQWWGYELFAVDDKPITIGKIAIAALMLLIGSMLSRRLSRALGNRMLPRLGIHDGASLALQTIGFYAMLLTCGFLTLEMLNIPLTAFTFLGGAAAIGVGFGSQNVVEQLYQWPDHTGRTTDSCRRPGGDRRPVCQYRANRTAEYASSYRFQSRDHRSQQPFPGKQRYELDVIE